MIKLSVIIPTFNRRDRLKKSLSSYIKEKINTVEFLVIDNCSSDGTKDLVQLMIKEDHRIKYFKNPQNLGYNRNLYRGYLEAKSNWICILPDDDAIEKGFLSELVDFINNNPNSSLILPAQKNDDNHINNPFFTKTTKLSGTEAFKLAFKSSGSVTGFTFNKLSLDQKQWNLDNSIYPQIRIALNLALENNVIYFKPQNFPIIGNYDSFDTTIKDDMGRPIDYGVIERLEILLDVSKKITKQQRSNIRHTLSAGLFIWSIGIAKLINVNNKENTLKYIKRLLKHNFIKSSSIFLGLLILKLVLSNKFTLIHRISVLGHIIGSILTSLLNINFYSSLIFGFKNIKRL